MQYKKPANAWQMYTNKGLEQGGLLWLTPEQKKQWRLSATKAGRSLTSHLRIVITEYLEKEACGSSSSTGQPSAGAPSTSPATSTE